MCFSHDISVVYTFVRKYGKEYCSSQTTGNMVFI